MTNHNSQTLSLKQRETLVGTLLGDGHLEKGTAGYTYRLCFSQSSKNPLYIAHMCTLWAPFIPPGGHTTRVYPNGGTTRGLRTRYLSLFVPYAQSFYRCGVKHVPSCIQDLLTARGLAYWYMDDGSMKSKKSKGVLLNIQGFCCEDVTHLCDVLQRKFHVLAWPRPQKAGTQHQVYISGRSHDHLRALITPYFTEDMWYKFPPPRVGIRNTFA
jgi:hypothetical protein